jgi:methyl-accepting chemotaxis protein
MRNGQQLAASLQSLNQQLDTSLVNSLALLDEMAKSAGSIASASRVGADDAVSSASAWI